MIFVNQLCFVYSVDKTSAATVDAVPRDDADLHRRRSRRRSGSSGWAAASGSRPAVSFAGVAFVAVGLGRRSRASVFGDALAVSTAAHLGDVLGRDHAADAAVLAVPDQRARARARLGADRRSPGSRRRRSQSFHFGTLVWVGFAFAVVGPLFLTNILWFTAIARVGPSRASLFSNLQPCVGAVFALVLLGEHLTRWEVVGGVADRSPRWCSSGPGGRLSSRPATDSSLTWLTVSLRERLAQPPAGLQPHDRPDPRDLRRADGDAAARRARPDDRRDRAAADRLRPRRDHAVLVGVHRLHAHLDGDRAALRPARRRATGGGRCS